MALPPLTAFQLEELDWYIARQNCPTAWLSESEQNRIKQFRRTVQASPDLRAQISEYLKNNAKRPINDARASAPALSNASQRYASTVFSSPPPSTVGRGGQVLSPSFLTQRKQDTWPDFVAYQQRQLEEQGQEEDRGATPRPNPGSRLSGSLLDAANPLIDMHLDQSDDAVFPSTPSLTGLSARVNDHIGHTDGVEDDLTAEAQTAEEVVQLFNEACERWKHHMKLALIADADMSRLGMMVRLFCKGQTNMGHGGGDGDGDGDGGSFQHNITHSPQVYQGSGNQGPSHIHPAGYGAHQNEHQVHLHGPESRAQGAGRASNINNTIHSARGGGNGGSSMPNVPVQGTDFQMNPQMVDNILHGLGISSI